MRSEWMRAGWVAVVAALAAACGPGGASAQEDAAAAAKVGQQPPVGPREATKPGFTVTPVATYAEPWAMAFLPDGRFLVTEKKGTLRVGTQAGAKSPPIAGTPKVEYGGQGGLGDVVLSPDFRHDRYVYLSWVEAGDGDTRGAAVGRAKLIIGPGVEGGRLEGLRVIWRQEPKVTGRGHFSHRMAFSPDGQFLFITSGERQKFTPAQDLSVNLGKVIRLTPTGGVPSTNPYYDQGRVTSQIWSYGHRNLLGIAFDAEGQLWDIEHGPAGGDEINLVSPKHNYGWPVVSNGDHYDGRPIPRHWTRPEFDAPKISWNPVIAPGDFIWYRGSLFPDWRGQALAVGLASQSLVRIAREGDHLIEVERYAFDNRLREIREGPDGALWVLEDGPTGRLLKLTPKAR
ncbi:MAG: PQQ-dependent sugar dehydrogenase [Sphingomonadaceae bacterium]|nr:PQQ-dependent sugar dehydrogenase [Sphingomonadaceae bacterium]